MDIYIGGVHDRNAALDGDVVAVQINPIEDWKILHEQLNDYLDDHLDLKQLVYNAAYEHLPESADNSISINLRDENKSTIQTGNKSVPITSIPNRHDPLEQKEDDVVIESDSSGSNSPKKNNKRRGKRGKKKKGTSVNDGVLDIVEYCDNHDEEAENPNDSLAILSCPIKLDIEETPKPRKPKSVFVPLEELSECDMSDDNASISSQSYLEHTLISEGDIIVEEPLSGKAIENLENVSVQIATVNTSVPTDKPPNVAVQQMYEPPIVENSIPVKLDDEIFCPIAAAPMSIAQGIQRQMKEISLQSDDHKNSMKKSNNSGGQVKSKNKIQKDKLRNIKFPKIKQEVATLDQVKRLGNYVDFLQRTAIVVCIVEKKHPRIAGGILKLFTDKNPDFALFCPTDNRIPRIKIPMSQCPPLFYILAEEHRNILYLAWIKAWNTPKFAFGELIRDIGLVGEINAEIESMLLSHMVDYSEFPDIIYRDLPKIPWSIPHEEFASRTDLRKKLICTIDPATARDLDDALSCELLDNGDFRVGVHIADVSYFIPIDSHLDKCAAQRATSVYISDRVIPMLPRPLCEDLCSLNPGEDRLTFSVIWILDPKGNIKNEWFGKTVIRSCIKMSYDHAQKMIDDPNRTWQNGELPPIADGHSISKISKTVNQLNKLAISMRKERVKQGALRLDQVQVGFSLDDKTKRPNGVFIYEQKDSNRLIEEFMLLANMSVARKIYQTYPSVAVLRKHPEPLKGPLLKMVQTLARNGIHLDVSSSGSLHNSIQKYIGSDRKSIAKMQLIVGMCSRPMQLAQYVCAGTVEDKDFRHYALSVPLYTHFTSPIRRYADVMVHRLIAAAIHPGQYNVPKWDKMVVAHKTQHCNDKKKAAKQVQEISTELFLALLVRETGEMVEEAIVIGILDKSVDVLLLKLGVVKRCYTDRLPLSLVEMAKQRNPCLILHWKPCKETNSPEIVQKLTYFDTITVILKPFDNKELKFNAILTRPECDS